MKVAVIGGGSMGSAFIKCWVNKKILPKENICVIESNPEKATRISSEYSVNVSNDLTEVQDYQIIFIAVKPQDFDSLACKLTEIVKPEQFLVSIMAGLSLKIVSDKLNKHRRLARVMPNLPIICAGGLSAYYSVPEVEHVALNILEQLLKAGGEVIRLDNESLLNSVTALSGSGPGYIFYFLKYLMKSATEFGFNEEQAKSIIAQTMKGSIELWIHDGRPAEELCSAVTSRGGTTEAALAHFDKHNLGTKLEEGIMQARLRADKLSLD